jgi:hypothetical protein
MHTKEGVAYWCAYCGDLEASFGQLSHPDNTHLIVFNLYSDKQCAPKAGARKTLNSTLFMQTRDNNDRLQTPDRSARGKTQHLVKKQRSV